MDVQIIRTDSGEELVVLPRREYDALLASLGVEEAEDRMTVRIAGEARRAIATGEEVVLPGWFCDAAMAGKGHPIRGLRKLRNLTQDEVAARAGITQGYYSDVERGAKQPTGDVLDRISDALQLDRVWLRALNRAPLANPSHAPA
jgi:DNA-binding XRE family transcriptional regulator